MSNPVGQLVMSSTETLGGSKRSFAIWLVLTVLMALVTVAFISTNATNGIVTFFVILLAILGIVLFYTGRKAFGAPKRFEVYNDGFILRDTKTEEVKDSGLWSEIEDIFWSEDKRKARNAAMGQALFGIIGNMIASSMTEGGSEEVDLFIQRSGQKKLTINTAYSQPDRPHSFLNRVTRDIWVEETMNVLNRGQTVAFGKLQVTPQGIQQDKQFVEWNAITGVQYKDDFGTVGISWQEPTRNRSKEIKQRLGYRGAVLREVIYQKTGIGSGYTKKLGKL
jgi:hypothetical protein